MAGSRFYTTVWVFLFTLFIGIVSTIVVAETSQKNSSSNVETITEQIKSLYPDVLADSFLFTLENISVALPVTVVNNLTAYNLLRAFILSVLAYLVYYIYRQLFTQFKVVRRYEGYTTTNGQSKKDAANDMRKRGRVGDLPPVYPNGWFSIVRSCDLKTGDVKYVTALGLELAVFRGEDGKAYIVDAYCPHLGANLGVGGQVKGNCLECPFHGWTFRGSDGKCVDVPYSRKVPDFAKTKAWRSLEVNGEIFIWYHAEGEEPGWSPHDIEGITKGHMTSHGFSTHYVNTHIQDISENGADAAHLLVLHSPFMQPGYLREKLGWMTSWLTHSWDIPENTGWNPHKDHKHIGVMRLRHSMSVFGYKIPQTEMPVEAFQNGPGVVHVYMHLPVVGTLVMVLTNTPLEPLMLRVTHAMYAPWYLRVIAKIILCEQALQLERDLMVWNHKTYIPKPVLVKEDSYIAKHRRWYSQFYSENSPRYSARKEGMDW